MSPWTVALLYLLVATLTRITTSTPPSFDCNDPATDYICEGGRYYKVLDDVLWQEAHDKCIGDGTQLAIAYSTQDIGAMKKVLGIEGKDTFYLQTGKNIVCP